MERSSFGALKRPAKGDFVKALRTKNGNRMEEEGRRSRIFLDVVDNFRDRFPLKNISNQVIAFVCYVICASTPGIGSVSMAIANRTEE